MFHCKHTLQAKTTVNKIEVSIGSDVHYRGLREMLHRCDPPCIPYLGIYLTDLTYIEEGRPDFTPDGLLNFSKMRMVTEPRLRVQSRSSYYI